MALHPGKMNTKPALDHCQEAQGPSAELPTPSTKAKSPNEWMVCGMCQMWELCYELEHGSQSHVLSDCVRDWLSLGGGERADEQGSPTSQAVLSIQML